MGGEPQTINDLALRKLFTHIGHFTEPEGFLNELQAGKERGFGF